MVINILLNQIKKTSRDNQCHVRQRKEQSKAPAGGTYTVHNNNYYYTSHQRVHKLNINKQKGSYTF